MRKNQISVVALKIQKLYLIIELNHGRRVDSSGRFSQGYES